MSVQYTANISIEQLTTSAIATFSWNVEYAAAMHEGVTLKNGTEIPPRPWVYEGLKQVDAVATYAALYQITNNADSAFRQTAIVLGAKFSELISSPIWDYPRATKRKSGEEAGSPRNIVDLGGLRASQQLVFE